MGLRQLIYALVIIHAIKSSWCHRKIRDGIPLGSVEKSYVVYFVKSDKSTVTYTDWVCAGALVTKLFIITAAACLEDVQYLYAVAGYKVLVDYKDIDIDSCTKTNKRKVVYTCVPKAYDFDYASVEKWSAIDIGVAKIDSEYEINTSECSYAPTTIAINYDPKYQESGVDAIIMGWGHKESWKQPGDETRMVQKDLDYAPVSIINKNKCKEGYNDYPELQQVIEKYMICTLGKGNIDGGGNLIATRKPDAEGCTKYEGDNCRRNSENKTNLESQNENDIVYNRRQGICQNDHGGPLVTWVGGHEYLIGVASVFRVNTESKCEGPYLYTSTQCNGAFLACVLKPKDGTRQGRSICDLPAKERGFQMIHKHISWVNHTDGTVDSEIIYHRPLVPLVKYLQQKTNNQTLVSLR